jgi:hypothetical protein
MSRCRLLHWQASAAVCDAGICAAVVVHCASLLDGLHGMECASCVCSTASSAEI